jgi:glutamate dehydrogenase (NAD(P)+)
MKYKNAMQNPLHGGAKAGIKFDPHNNQAKEVLRRFLHDNKDILRSQWVTAADLNTDNRFIHSVLKDIGLGSGFFALGKLISDLEGISNQAFNLIEKISCQVDSFAPLSECATGFGVACTINWLNQNSLPRVIIQGFGAVGSSVAYFIHKYGFGKVVGIIEKDCYIYHDKGIDLERILSNKQEIIKGDSKSCLYSILVNHKQFIDHQLLIRDDRSNENDEDFLCRFFTSQKADIFVPCANRYVISRNVLETLKNHTFSSNKSSTQVKWIICGANNAFADESLILQLLNDSIYTVPSWVSNCGNATLFVESLKIERVDNYSNWSRILLKKIKHKIESFLIQAMDNCSNNKKMLYFSCYLLAENLIKTHVPNLKNFKLGSPKQGFSLELLPSRNQKVKNIESNLLD